MMKIAIAGGSGFIGSALANQLTANGHSVLILTRNNDNKQDTKNVTFVEWLKEGSTPEKELARIDAFVNLAGESLNSGRWTEKRKRRILKSRIDATKEAIAILHKLDQKPEILINASAIGYYGTSFKQTFTEQNKESGDDFLAEVVKSWEAEASHAITDNIRVAYMRFGMVLDDNEGALNQMMIPFKLFAGGPLGTGKQWISWVHIDDVIGSIIFTIENNKLSGPVNVTAPTPVQMNEFGRKLADVINRPYWLPSPSIALKTVLGDMSVLVLEGQRVIPEKLQHHQYPFQFPELEGALKNLLSES
ncbi:TIGR01777 family oxidoreductase [Alteribacter populi]|uniref:TIGR01777 family oxidoreductase n=1 Tax=Alteribacter populi TaxID=2011011 RepID=UPI00315B3C4A